MKLKYLLKNLILPKRFGNPPCKHVAADVDHFTRIIYYLLARCPHRLLR
jgi:hypothetical protein